MDKKKTKAKTTKKIDLHIGLSAILESTKEEYQYLQEAKNSLQTRTGILIALLTALVSAAFIKEPIGFVELFKTNLFLAHFKLIALILLLLSFLFSLVNYIRIFFTREFQVFNYENFTQHSEEEITKLNSNIIIISIYKEYAKCIRNNEDQFSKMINSYKKGNGWLIATIIFTIISIAISLI